jgi:hypothetical protein
VSFSVLFQATKTLLEEEMLGLGRTNKPMVTLAVQVDAATSTDR